MNNKILITIILLILLLSGLYFVFRPSKNISTNIQLEVVQIGLNEIESHNTKENCWTTINGGVYDITKFISSHKGGDKILNACGVDATDFFTGKHPTIGRVHSAVAVKLLESMKIGTLKQ